MALQPMTEDAYINRVIKDNSRVMAAEKIQLTPAALQQALRAAWRAGEQAVSERLDRDDSLFGKVFGKVWDR